MADDPYSLGFPSPADSGAVPDPARRGNQPARSRPCVAVDDRAGQGAGGGPGSRGGGKGEAPARPQQLARRPAVATPARRLQRAREEEARGSKREAAAVSFQSVTVYLHVLR